MQYYSPIEVLRKRTRVYNTQNPLQQVPVRILCAAWSNSMPGSKSNEGCAWSDVEATLIEMALYYIGFANATEVSSTSLDSHSSNATWETGKMDFRPPLSREFSRSTALDGKSLHQDMFQMFFTEYLSHHFNIMTVHKARHRKQHALPPELLEPHSDHATVHLLSCLLLNSSI